MTALQLRLLALGDGQVTLAEEDDDVRGLVVLDAGGHRVGEVEDLVVDDLERRARLLVVAWGGVLGLGTDRRVVPVEAVARVTDHVRLRHSDSDVLAGPELVATPADPPDCTAVYRHFGCTPFWEPGHTGAYFHDRRW